MNHSGKTSVVRSIKGRAVDVAVACCNEHLDAFSQTRRQCGELSSRQGCLRPLRSVCEEPEAEVECSLHPSRQALLVVGLVQRLLMPGTFRTGQGAQSSSTSLACPSRIDA